MTEIPEPLTPPDCDLRGYDFMPIYGHRLFASDFYLQADGDTFRAGMRLWWAAWQACPAGSLPADDVALCRLADLGRDVDGWLRVKELALRGFVQCSDGRLYHPMLAEMALDAWDRRRRERERKAASRKKGRGMSRGQGADSPGALATDDDGANGDGGELSAGQDADAPENDVSAGQDADNGCSSAGQDADGPRMSGVREQNRTEQNRKKESPLTPAAGAAGGKVSSSMKSKGPPGNSRAHGTNPRARGENPRAVAASAATARGEARPALPAPSSPLWRGFQAKGVGPVDFVRWIEPLVVGADDGEATVYRAPSAFHASHVRTEYGHLLRLVVGRPVEVVGPGAALGIAAE